MLIKTILLVILAYSRTHLAKIMGFCTAPDNDTSVLKHKKAGCHFGEGQTVSFLQDTSLEEPSRTVSEQKNTNFSGSAYYIN